MKSSIDLKWLGNMTFETEVNGHKLIMDVPEKVGGNDKGPRPKPLMLVALAGCTAMDVVSILKKMRVKLEKFNVRTEGEIATEHPKSFKNMKIIYEFTGKNLPMKKLEKAINLSKDKYCAVSASFKKAFEITHEIIIK
ncbi:MAG: osmotically inducible protein C [Bacteroidetes bacterium 4572_128]|nr:MAG: osmotically inducible protein C [Bacteroidetes bacterium 4572_128]